MRDASPPSVNGQQIVAFVTPGCAPCEDLVISIRSALDEGLLPPAALLFVVWATPTDHGEALAATLPGPAVIDSDGALARACEVRATPAVFILSRPDFRVVDFSPKGDIRWIQSYLTSRLQVTTAT